MNRHRQSSCSVLIDIMAFLLRRFTLQKQINREYTGWWFCVTSRLRILLKHNVVHHYNCRRSSSFGCCAELIQLNYCVNAKIIEFRIWSDMSMSTDSLLHRI